MRATVLEMTRYNGPHSCTNTNYGLNGCAASLSSDVRREVSARISCNECDSLILLRILSFIVPVISITCNRLMLSLRGLYSKQELSDRETIEGEVSQHIHYARI